MHYCEHCGKRIDTTYSPVGVTIHELEKFTCAGSFCGWECAAMWFEHEAGKVLTREADTSRASIGEIEIIEND